MIGVLRCEVALLRGQETTSERGGKRRRDASANGS